MQLIDHIRFYCVLLFGFALAGISLASGPQESEPYLASNAITDGLFLRYKSTAEQLLALIKSSPAHTQIPILTEDLFSFSTEIMQRATSQMPECRDYFMALLAVQDKLLTLPLDQLEADYHHDGALPPGSVDCYHIKDLLVHPATVLILLSDDSISVETIQTQMIAEIDEVLEHIGLAAASLNHATASH